MQTLQQSIASMAAWPRFFVWRLANWNGKKFKDKHPWGTDGAFDAKELCLRNELLTFEQAHIWLNHLRTNAAVEGVQYSLGWYVMADAGYWFLDLDEHVIDGVWSGLAQEVSRQLPGVFCEYSSSNRGLHFVGRGALLPHKTSGRGMPEGVELYSSERGICFGLSGMAWGNADVAGIPPYQVPPNRLDDAQLEQGRMPEWQGPEDDDDLIAQMLNSRQGLALIQGRASLQQLWAGDYDALDKVWPGIKAKGGNSDADGALSSRLAWWTGCDVPRMIRLMWRSGLVRDKWDAQGHETYLQITCETACKLLLERGRNCLGSARDLLPLPQPVIAIPAPPPEDEPHRGVPAGLEILARAGNTDELKEAAARVAAMGPWDALDIEALAQRLRRKSKDIIGDHWAIAACRQMVSGVAISSGGAGELGAPDWLCQWVFISGENRYCNADQGFVKMGKEALHVTLYHKPELPRKGNGDKEDAAKMFNMWGVRVVSGETYDPRDASMVITNREGVPMLNTFYGTSPMSAGEFNKETVAVFEQHVLNITNGDVEAQQMLLRWMAHVVQRPGVLIKWAIMLIGVPGSGKSMFSKPLELALGRRNVQYASAKSVNNKGGFMDWAASAHQLGVLNDFSITGPDKFQTAEATKPVISDEIVSITSKGNKDITYDNYAAYIASTNVREPMPMTKGERRWYMHSTRWLDEMVRDRPLEAALYFIKVHAAIKANTPEQWRAYFESIVVGDMPNVAPMTQSMLAVIANNSTEAQQAISELVANTNVVTSNKITEVLRSIEDAPQRKAISRLMNDLGFDHYDKGRVTIGANKVGIYVRSGAIDVTTAPQSLIFDLAKKFAAAHDAAKFMPGQ